MQVPDSGFRGTRARDLGGTRGGIQGAAGARTQRAAAAPACALLPGAGGGARQRAARSRAGAVRWQRRSALRPRSSPDTARAGGSSPRHGRPFSADRSQVGAGLPPGGTAGPWLCSPDTCQRPWGEERAGCGAGALAGDLGRRLPSCLRTVERSAPGAPL